MVAGGCCVMMDFTDTDAQSVCLGLGFGRNDAMMMSLSSFRYKSLVFAKFC